VELCVTTDKPPHGLLRGARSADWSPVAGPIGFLGGWSRTRRLQKRGNSSPTVTSTGVVTAGASTGPGGWNGRLRSAESAPAAATVRVVAGAGVSVWRQRREGSRPVATGAAARGRAPGVVTGGPRADGGGDIRRECRTGRQAPRGPGGREGPCNGGGYGTPHRKGPAAGRGLQGAAVTGRRTGGRRVDGRSGGGRPAARARARDGVRTV